MRRVDMRIWAQLMHGRGIAENGKRKFPLRLTNPAIAML
jgi:hypothetical protein